MTLEQICEVGKTVLEEYKPLVVGEPLRYAERTIDSAKKYDSHEDITEAEVRFHTLKVLDGLAALPPDTYMSQRYSDNIGGVVEQVVAKGNVGLAYRLEADPYNFKLDFVMGGFLVVSEQAAH
jgi:hypothetical protein